ncbi:MFS general substrate transporter [Rhizopus microsporus]|uniref:MFS general substrate transporter n=1 Tax=Rhizopus microsporus TaxID=58291 RepID=A0A1X0S4B5_RHIZD|nr:MFS general substrate transporter [Rhizopus microsporus]
MINERNLTLDHPSTDKVSSNQEALSYTSDHSRQNSDATEVEVDEKAVATNENPIPQIIDEEDQHDGGYGWFVVLGAFFVQVTSFGTITSVMQDYYEQHLFGEDPKSTLNLSFVGTLALICLNVFGPIAQILVSMLSIRPVLIFGTICIGLGLEMASLSSQIWHLYLTQGILFGIGASCIYMAIMGVAPQWFNKRRGLALGLVASGSGIGGLVIPLIMNAINNSLGSGWTYRILGFICLFCDGMACILVRERNPPSTTRKRFSQIVQFSVLKNPDYVLFAIGSNIGLFGYFIPYFFLPSYATYVGLTETQGSALVTVSAAGNFVGRVAIGFLADRIGKINSNLIFVIITSLSSFLIWTFANSYGSLMAFSVVFGLTSGAYFAQISPITASILGMKQLSSGLSLLLLTNVIPVFGPNIASAIETGVSSTPFFSYKMFTGVAYLLSAVFILILRLRLI